MRGTSFIWKFNPKIYPLGNIFSIAQTFVDRAYVTIDGDLNEQMTIEMRAKDKSIGLDAIKRDFGLKLKDELQAAGIQVVPTVFKEKIKQPSYLDDPYKIAIPFEKRFGKKK